VDLYIKRKGNIMKLKEKFESFVKEKVLVEIMTKSNREVVGILKEVGEDYITISHSIDREITTKNDSEKKIQIEVLNLETSLKLEDIDSISKIVSKITK